MKNKVILVAVAILLVTNYATAVHYEVIDLGTVSAFNTTPEESTAYSINDNGQIVGWSGGTHATLFDSTGNGNNIYLGSFSTTDSACLGRANSINNNGQIVGRATGVHTGGATLFDPTGNYDNLYLGGLPAQTQSSGMAYSINDSGQIVGWANLYSESTGIYYSHAAIFDGTGNGNNIALGTLGGTRSNARAINNNGIIVGYATLNSSSLRATVFDNTGMGNNIDLGTLGGDYSIAFAINDNDQIVGHAFNEDDNNHAVLYDAINGNIDLGTLGGANSSANGINDIGQIVGSAWDDQSQVHATLFDSTGNGQNISLNSLIDPALGWNLVIANDINNNGQVVGWGINPDGYNRAFLLTPVPEPTTLLLLGLGGLLIRKRQL